MPMTKDEWDDDPSDIKDIIINFLNKAYPNPQSKSEIVQGIKYGDIDKSLLSTTLNHTVRDELDELIQDGLIAGKKNRSGMMHYRIIKK